MNLKRSLFGASLLVVQPLILNLLSLPATAYIIAVLGPTDYGQWGIALSLTFTAAALTNLGTRSYFVRRVAADPDCAPQAFAEHLGIRSALGFVAGIVSTLACVLLGYPLTVIECTAVLTLNTVLTAVTTSVSDLLQAREKLPAMATINFIAGLVLTLASVAVMFFGLGPTALAWSYVAGPLLSAAGALYVVHRRLFPVRIALNARRYVALLKECRVMGFQQLIFSIATQAENLLVPKMVSIAEYGYFAAGTMLTRRMEVIPDALSTAFYPTMVKQYREGSPKALKTVRTFIHLSFWLCVPPAIVVYLLADPIANLLFKEAPELCAWVTKLTVWMVPLLSLAYALGYSLNAAGREVQETRVMIQVAVLGLLGSCALVWSFGVTGACISLVFRQLLGIAIRLPYFVRSVQAEGGAPIPPAEPAPANLPGR